MVLLLVDLFLIVVVLLQTSKGDGLTPLTGSQDTFFGKNKSKTFEGKLKLMTRIAAVAVAVLSLALVLVQRFAA